MDKSYAKKFSQIKISCNGHPKLTTNLQGEEDITTSVLELSILKMQTHHLIGQTSLRI